jgi:hypothetical protein
MHMGKNGVCHADPVTPRSKFKEGKLIVNVVSKSLGLVTRKPTARNNHVQVLVLPTGRTETPVARWRRTGWFLEHVTLFNAAKHRLVKA